MTTLLLERLLNHKESTNFIIIEDTILQSGYVLLKEFIKKAVTNQYVINYFLYLTQLKLIDIFFEPDRNRCVLLLCFEFSPKWFLENINSIKKYINFSFI
jgi:hypothetical protein